MECSQNVKVSKEEVLAKLKDDGDFDRLRRKIIQKLKNNELRESIISIVKQSEALNRRGAENMKPRQLSDDIFQEVGEKVMSQISDGLWGIIRSSDGMQSEISETVHSVYNKLAIPRDNAEGRSSSAYVAQVHVESSGNGLVVGAARGAVDGVSDNEPKEPPGFSVPRNHVDDNNRDEVQVSPHEKGTMTEQQKMLQDKMDTDVDRVVTLGFSTDTEQKQECYGSDEDPDVPSSRFWLMLFLMQFSLSVLLCSYRISGTMQLELLILQLMRKFMLISSNGKISLQLSLLITINTTDILFHKGI